MATANRKAAARHRAEELAATLPPLLVAAERVASTVAQGVHGRRRVGQGETFWQFRRYQPGDSAQMIDWRQSARSQHLFVRETEWEAAQSVWLWRDGSASMRYRSGKALPEKVERAELLVLALASLLVRGGERIALLDGNAVPSSGQATLERVAATVARPERSAGPATEDSSLPRYRLLPRYATLVLMGDFLAPLDRIDALARRFGARGVRTHLVQVLDPAEETLPFHGRTRFEGLEDEGDVLIRRVESARGDYRGRMAAHIEGLRAIARRAGWTYVLHRTDRPPEAALLTLYMALSGPTQF